MPNLIVPAKAAETLRRNASDFVWPEGAYAGVFETADMKDLPQAADGSPFAGYVAAGDEGRRLSLRIGNISAMEDQATAEQIGARKWFVDLVLQDGNYSVDTPYDQIPNEAWQLRRSVEMIANLAAALGEIQLLDDGQNAAVTDGFVENLEAGQYNNAPITFVVYHKTNKKDKDAPYQEIQTFLAG
jgi:hypothetical protein